MARLKQITYNSCQELLEKELRLLQRRARRPQQPPTQRTHLHGLRARRGWRPHTLRSTVMARSGSALYQGVRRRRRNQNRDKDFFKKVLQAELDRLISRSSLGHELSFKWIPTRNSDRHGEVTGNVIYVYDEKLEEALRTLKHEFIDHWISSEVVAPLVDLINLQKGVIDNLVYRRKEDLVNGIAELL